MTQKYEHAVRELNRIERMTLPELRAACKHRHENVNYSTCVCRQCDKLFQVDENGE